MTYGRDEMHNLIDEAREARLQDEANAKAFAAAAANHTPGPWFVDQYGHVYAMVKVDAHTEKSVCLLDGRHSAATRPDKNLIGAAPDLLAALKSIANDGYDAATCEEIARVAIAKVVA